MERTLKHAFYLAWLLPLVLAACAPQPGTPALIETDTDSPLSNPTSVPTTAADLVQPTPDIEEVPTSQATDSPIPSKDMEYQIITLLPPDAIPSIDDPVFLSAEEADAEYAPDEEVLGVVFNGEARAYSIPLLSGREIVNDTIAGRKIAVTW